MLKLRLQKVGKKKTKIYRIVLINNNIKSSCNYLKILGFYNPVLKQLIINKKKIYQYLKNGVYPTNTVRHLIYKVFNS